jgi:hypothetical protein
VAAIFYNATPLPFSATSDTALTVALQTAQGSALNPALAAPQYTLQIVCADKSQFSYLVPVQATATTK